MKFFVHYIFAMLYFQTNGTCSGLAKTIKGISHDSFTRFLKQEWSGQKRLEHFIEPECIDGGYLIIDDTPIEKPHSKTLEGLSWVYSSTMGKLVYGYSTVVLLWTDGRMRIPIGQKLWRRGGKTKIELAMELLSYARNQLKLKPDYVLFDSWYSAKKLLKRIKDYGWYFVTRLKKNRNFNGQRLTRGCWNRYFRGVGRLTGGLKVFVAKNDGKYLASNKLSLNSREMEALYQIRSSIEEVNKLLKQHCYWKSCQIDNFKAQEHHLWCALIAFTVLELERLREGTTIYELRNLLTRRGSKRTLALFDRVKEVA